MVLELRIGYSGMSDAELVHCYQTRSDELAFRELHHRYEGLIRSKASLYFIQGADRNDVLQEGALGFWEAVRDYAHGAGSCFGSFADNCIKRKIISAVIAGLRQKSGPLNDAFSYDPLAEDGEKSRYSLIPRGEGPEKIVLSRAGAEEIMRMARERLSEREFACLVHVADGDTYKEIVDELRDAEPEKRARKVRQVDNAIQRGRKKMKRAMAHA